jgi:SAM domain (Sterile alpha motif)
MDLALVLRSSPHGRCLPHPLRCLVLSARVEAMKKRSRAGGGKPAKARSRKPSRLKRNIAPRAVAHRNAATERIAEWLEKLGLGQYAQRFAENDISFAVLPDLTDQHLKGIGVSLGHRLQLLRAIAELPSGAKAPKAAAAAAAPAASQDTAERRQVTVMFSDSARCQGGAGRVVVVSRSATKEISGWLENLECPNAACTDPCPSIERYEQCLWTYAIPPPRTKNSNCPSGTSQA